MEWTKEALTAGVEKSIEVQGYPRSQVTIEEFEEAMAKLPAVLDAAIKAQGLEEKIREDALAYIAAVGQAQENYARGRAEALEEAAAAFSKLAFEKNESPNLIREYCAAIRALK